jgi:hypothetical protein
MDEEYTQKGGEVESFFSYMIQLSQKDKSELLNIVQYITLAIVPISLVVKLMKMYLPPFDDYKGSLELLMEVILQLVALLLLFWFIHRFIVFIPTYSKESYSSLNVFHFIIPFIFVLFTLDTTISKKASLLLNRVFIYIGIEKEAMQSLDDTEEIYTPPSIQVPCPGPMNNPYPQNTKEENGKNYNYEKPDKALPREQGPMAANEALGLYAF